MKAPFSILRMLGVSILADPETLEDRYSTTKDKIEIYGIQPYSDMHSHVIKLDFDSLKLTV